MFRFGLLAMCLAYLAPGHYLPWLSFQGEWLAAMGACLVALSLISSCRSNLSPILGWPWIALLAITVAIVPLVQWIAGKIDFASDAVLSALYMAGFAASIVVAANLIALRREAFLDGVFAVFAVAALVSTGLALHQWLQLGSSLYITDIAPHSRPFANIAQPNQLATLLSLGAITFIREFENRRIGWVVAAIGVAFLGCGLLITQSRTGLLIVGVIGVASAAGRRNCSLRLTGAAITAVIVAFFLGVLAWDSINELLDSSALPQVTRTEPGPRLVIWASFIDAFKSAPWLGYGWEQSSHAHMAFALDHPIRVGILTSSHNIILDLIIWCGTPIALLIVASFSAWYVMCLARAIDADAWALSVGIAVILTHAMLEYPLTYTYFLLPLGFLIGALDGLTRPGAGVRIHWLWLVVPVALLWIATVCVGREYLNVENSFRSLQLAAFDAAIDDVVKISEPDVSILDGLRDYHRFSTLEPTSGLSLSDLDWMRKVVRRFPDPKTQLRWAQVAGLNNLPHEAEEMLKLLCSMHRPPHCRSAQATWARYQLKYEQLRAIKWPAQ